MCCHTHAQGGFPFGGFGQDIFEQIFQQSGAFAQMFGRVAANPVRISFMVGDQRVSLD
jgi:hypothetical protein